MIRPLNNNLVIKQIVEETLSGIYIPNPVKNLYAVIAIGKSVMETKVGDKVIVDIDKLREIKYQGITYFLISEDYVLGIVED